MLHKREKKYKKSRHSKPNSPLPIDDKNATLVDSGFALNLSPNARNKRKGKKSPVHENHKFFSTVLQSLGKVLKKKFFCETLLIHV